MYFVAAATDYDGTIAHHGSVNAETISTLTRLRASGRHLILVTGRELPDLRRVFADLALFDRIVAENGALLYVPETDEERALAPEPPAALVQRLHEAKVEPLSVGRAIIATWEPNETAVLEAIRDLGLEMQIIFNKGACDLARNIGLGLVIEIKERRRVEETIARLGEVLVAAGALEDVVVISFDHPSLLQVKERIPGARTEIITHARHIDMVAAARGAGKVLADGAQSRGSKRRPDRLASHSRSRPRDRSQ